ncbi:DUF5960 family protein [Fundicoccus sp. Sow4_F4]|uniref:DUF5960 family protein n=1 Tax=Fundicoccus sp. Sow4_F4 TaxID=3438783 RepID=UPI003F931E0D
MTDDLLMSMAGAQKSYFILNRHNANDHRDHYYLFNVKVISEPKTVHIYEYVGHRFSL